MAWNPSPKVAAQIAEKLFTNGMGSKAQRLVLELPGGKDGGGWCKKAVIDVIDAALQQATTPQEKEVQWIN